MKKLLALLLTLQFTCELIKLPVWVGGNFIRCENDEVLCYIYNDYMSCEFTGEYE